uniref:Secreted protein n=1 Tax=Rhizophora mucronata TaxID=61149 RepID=A0A2P2IS81_RHIMU
MVLFFLFFFWGLNFGGHDHERETRVSSFCYLRQQWVVILSSGTKFESVVKLRLDSLLEQREGLCLF